MNAIEAFNEAFGLASLELDRIINRRFSPPRTLIVERESEKHWTATIDGDKVLYRSPDGMATLRFAQTFAARNAGVEVELVDYSVRVENVVELRP